MEFLFLGTGAGIPSKQRNVSAIALRFLTNRKGDLWLFDCGEATQHQILYTKLKLTQITKIFITHMHGDHIYGLPGVLGSRSFQGGEKPLTIYGPRGINAFVTVALETSKTYLKYPLNIIEIEDGFLEKKDGYTIKVGLLEHVIPSYGYRICEPAHPGKLNVQRLKELNIPPGPTYSRLKNGESVTLNNGEVLHGNDFIGPQQPGRIITICGDTRPTDRAVQLAKESDLLIHEATFQHGLEENAINYFHSTTAQAANLAIKANVKRLILTHISARYYDMEEEFLESARNLFIDTELAQDFLTVSLPKRKDRS